MAKFASNAALLAITIDRASGDPIHRQIYQQIRTSVLSGLLHPGTRLPSTRTVAQEIGCARSTVECAFDQLVCEGYLVGKVGVGTIVCDSFIESPAVSLRQRRSPAPVQPHIGPRPSERCDELAALARWRAPSMKPFAPGIPDTERFPFPIWARLMGRFWRQPGHDLVYNNDLGGYYPLREAIANHLRVNRGIKCKAEQIVITAGAQQAVDLAAKLLLNAGDTVWLENPGYPPWRKLGVYGARLQPVPVGPDGISVADGVRLAPDARMAIVTPNRQFPTGVAMTLARRLELLDWAYANGAWVVEDDYDSEFRYGGKPLATLLSLDQHGHVIYAGTFSKVIFPGLRLGYLVLPDGIIDDFCRARLLADYYPPITMQPVLAAFIEEGHFAAHFRRMKQLYEERQAVLVDASHHHLTGLVDLAREDAGMHLVGRLSPIVSEHMTDREAARLAAEVGVHTPAMQNFCFGEPTVQALLFGYAAVPETEIRLRIRALGEEFEKRVSKRSARMV